RPRAPPPPSRPPPLPPAPPPAPPPASARKEKDCEPARCHIWASGETLLWWVRDGSTPTLLTAAPVSGGGIPGPGSPVFGGGSDLDYGMLVGARASAGLSNAAGNLGAEVSGLYLGRGSADFAAGSRPSGSPAPARPVPGALPTQPGAAPVSFPGQGGGAFAVNSSSQLWGGEGNAVGNVFSGQRVGLDLLAGFRYVDLDETLTIHEASALLGAGAA